MREDHLNRMEDLLKCIEYNTSVLRLNVEKSEKLKISEVKQVVEPWIDSNILRIQGIFFRKLEAKTGWGRNEIKRAFIESIQSPTDEPETDIEDFNKCSSEECPF